MKFINVFNKRRIIVVYDPAVSKVLRCDGLHLILCELEIPDVEILFHSLYMDGFRDDGNAALSIPSESHLGCCLSVLFADGGEFRICEDAVFSFR